MPHVMLKPRAVHQAGFNLIEASLVLGIVGLVVGGIFAAWSSVENNNRIRGGADQATVTLQQIRSLYGNRNQLDSAPTANFTNALIAGELIPRAWLNDAGVLKNPWGGNLLITPDSYTSGLMDAVNISYTNMKKDTCKNLANRLVNVARTQGLYKIDTTNVSASTNFNSIAGSVCNGGTVSFYFTLKTNN